MPRGEGDRVKKRREGQPHTGEAGRGEEAVSFGGGRGRGRKREGAGLNGRGKGGAKETRDQGGRGRRMEVDEEER